MTQPRFLPMGASRQAALAALLLVPLAACSSTTETGPAEDAQIDGGEPDAQALVDAGAEIDAGQDAGVTDVGFPPWDGAPPSVSCGRRELAIAGGLLGYAVDVRVPHAGVSSGFAGAFYALHGAGAVVFIDAEEDPPTTVTATATVFVGLRDHAVDQVVCTTTVVTMGSSPSGELLALSVLPSCEDAGPPGPGTVRACVDPFDKQCPGGSGSSIDSTVPGLQFSFREAGGSVGGSDTNAAFAMSGAFASLDASGQSLLFMQNPAGETEALCVGAWRFEGEVLELSQITRLGPCSRATPAAESALAFCYARD